MPTASTGPFQIEIVVDGRLDPRRSGWFEGMTLISLPDGTTRITGYVPDQAALYGLISRIRDLGLQADLSKPCITRFRINQSGVVMRSRSYNHTAEERKRNFTMSIDPVEGHFGNWIGFIIWTVVFLLFLAFLPFYKRSQRKPAGVYAAFVVALALEMFGVPLSMYVITWIAGKTLPDGILWGHTLVQLIGLNGMYVAIPMYLIGGADDLLRLAANLPPVLEQGRGQGPARHHRHLPLHPPPAVHRLPDDHPGHAV